MHAGGVSRSQQIDWTGRWADWNRCLYYLLTMVDCFSTGLAMLQEGCLPECTVGTRWGNISMTGTCQFFPGLWSLSTELQPLRSLFTHFRARSLCNSPSGSPACDLARPIVSAHGLGPLCYIFKHPSIHKSKVMRAFLFLRRRDMTYFGDWKSLPAAYS